MDNLADRLSRLLTPEMKAKVENAIRRDMATQSNSLRCIPPDPMAAKGRPIPNLNNSNDDFLQSLAQINPRFPPLEKLPCANVQAEQYTACEDQGKLACSACKLVSYCSKECQNAHWRLHKRDCKNRMRSANWMPIWVIENRLPSFINNSSRTFNEEFQQMRSEEFSVGCSLWGNTPAMDVINLSHNEKDAKKDFSLAFVASGDLRHVVHTVNSLPSNFSGNLDILINDGALPVICRNIVLLLILGTISDEIIAADVALHFWYSAFIPMEYRSKISIALISFIRHDSLVFPLGPHSTFSCCLHPDVKDYFLYFISSSITMGDAQNEYDRVRNAPSRHDFRDRMYMNLKLSHRVAFQEFRRFGIVLPFGAANAHFNYPNHSLFSPEGRWLQTDYADPLEGWDLGKIVEIGKAHKANPEDIYGCLYFFLSEQLRTFARRLRTFKINFKVFSLEACHLARLIRQNEFEEYGVPGSIRFDRIAVSNILDYNYVGLRGVLINWAPLLAETSTAVLVGYFMNWVARQEDGRATGANESVSKQLMKRLTDKIKVEKVNTRNFGEMASMIYGTMLGDIDAFYDNSKPFSTFLKKEGLKDILGKTKLRLREKHTIVPHRDMVSLEAPPNALPEFPDDESWYYHSKLSSNSWSSRYVEFVRG